MSATTLSHRWCVGIDLHKETLTACVYCSCCGEIRFQKLRLQMPQSGCGILWQFAAAARGGDRGGGILPLAVGDAGAVGRSSCCWPMPPRRGLWPAGGSRPIARMLRTSPNYWRVAVCPWPMHLPWKCRCSAIVRGNEMHFSRQRAGGPDPRQKRDECQQPSRAGTDGQCGTDSLPGNLPAKAARATRSIPLAVRGPIGADRAAISQLERELERLLAQPDFESTAAILNSFPGVGPVTCATVLAEIGDFHRFTYRKAIARYGGFDPRTFDSAGKQRTGHISKRGPSDLRWVLGQAAWAAVRTDPRVKSIWLRISRKAGKKAAIIAVARRMLLWMWRAVRTGQPYRAPVAAVEPTLEGDFGIDCSLPVLGHGLDVTSLDFLYHGL